MRCKPIESVWSIELALAACTTTMSARTTQARLECGSRMTEKSFHSCPFIGMMDGASSDALKKGWKARGRRGGCPDRDAGSQRTKTQTYSDVMAGDTR